MKFYVHSLAQETKRFEPENECSVMFIKIENFTQIGLIGLDNQIAFTFYSTFGGSLVRRAPFIAYVSHADRKHLTSPGPKENRYSSTCDAAGSEYKCSSKNIFKATYTFSSPSLMRIFTEKTIKKIFLRDSKSELLEKLLWHLKSHLVCLPSTHTH